ncbi:MFS multidrug transporter [Purpureocillium lilacinum]|uniref:MFS multidrug transporter n=1 Tax=Purpureocillium lilacinum TaxID=33203 RepID=A0A179HQD6_PURLI|nr:MFS multidrug transporter [Purpureocillium lilacinum]OAQ91640.1 MFS multidrug transporter [Purpureocillium lilacinum]
MALETTPLRSEEGERDDGLDQSEAYAASFDPDGGSDDPMQWPEAYKWAMVVLLALMSFTVTFTCISVVPVASRIVKDLDGDSDETPSQSAGVLLVTIWELGEAAGPLLIAPLSEALGRAPLLHGTNALFILATLLAALSRSTGALVAARALTGAAVSSNVLYPPIVGDVFPPEQRGRALSVFMFATLLGGTLGPAFGGAAAEGMPMLGGWRAVLWASLALATLCEGLALVFFRETYAVAILRRRAAARRLGGRDKALLPGPSSVGETSLGTKEEGSAAGFHVSSITRPFAVLFGSGVLASLAVFGSVIFSYFYVVSVTLPTILDEIYGLSPAAIGSSFLANGIGSLIGIAICNLSLDRIYVKLKTKNDGVGLPEYRLPLAIVGAFILPPGVALYGSCAEYRLPLWLLYASVVWVRMALILVFLPLMAYVVDAYGIYSASAMTGVIVVRCLAGAFLPVVTVLVIQDLGYGWGFATLSALCLVLGFIPVVIMRYGSRCRQAVAYP